MALDRVGAALAHRVGADARADTSAARGLTTTH